MNPVNPVKTGVRATMRVTHENFTQPKTADLNASRVGVSKSALWKGKVECNLELSSLTVPNVIRHVKGEDRQPCV